MVLISVPQIVTGRKKIASIKNMLVCFGSLALATVPSSQHNPDVTLLKGLLEAEIAYSRETPKRERLR